MSTAVAVGSLSAVADGSKASLAESMMDIDALLVVDMSGSMGANDAPGGLTRYEVAEEELRDLQESMPGKIGVVAFSGQAEFIPGGVPPRFGGGTDMAKVLRLVLPFDGLADIVMISDGCPDSESETLDVAARFKHKIDTVYIGPTGGTVWGASGAGFLKSLAAATGGQATKGKAPGLLKNEVIKLLTSEAA